MRFTIFIGLLLIITGCSVKKDVPGYYSWKGEREFIKLAINQDSSFLINHSAFEARSRGKGTWAIRNDSLILRFQDYQADMLFSRDYRADMVLNFKLLKNGGLRSAGIAILKRRKKSIELER